MYSGLPRNVPWNANPILENFAVLGLALDFEFPRRVWGKINNLETNLQA
jgi:hypothetical protein